MPNVIIREPISLLNYLTLTNRLHQVCSCCGKQMFSNEQIDAFKRFKEFPSTKKGIELRIQDELTHKFNKCQEPDDHKWALIGIGSPNGERYFWDVCWDCFRTNLRNRATDGKHVIPCNTKKNSWWMRTIKGENDAYPTGQASAIGKYWADLMFTSLSKDELDSISSKFDTASLDSFKRRYGDVDGQLKYEEYVKFHSTKNTFEYKHKHLGWSKEQFDEFNKNRSVTLELCIKKHGAEVGRKIFEEYCEKQSYSGCKLEYFIEKYGELGSSIYEELNKRKSIHSTNKWSKISQELFDNILNKLPQSEWRKVNYATFNGGEKCIQGSDMVIYPDFIYKTKIIEFYGDYWHRNPNMYSESELYVKDVWEYDNKRINEIKRMGYDILIVWENDYRNDRESIIDECMKFLYN